MTHSGWDTNLKVVGQDTFAGPRTHSAGLSPHFATTAADGTRVPHGKVERYVNPFVGLSCRQLHFSSVGRSRFVGVGAEKRGSHARNDAVHGRKINHDFVRQPVVVFSEHILVHGASVEHGSFTIGLALAVVKVTARC